MNRRPLLHQVVIHTDALGLVVTATTIDDVDLGQALRAAVVRAGAMRDQRNSMVQIAPAADGFTVRSTADFTLAELRRFLHQLQRDLVCGQAGLDSALADLSINSATTNGFHRHAA